MSPLAISDRRRNQLPWAFAIAAIGCTVFIASADERFEPLTPTPSPGDERTVVIEDSSQFTRDGDPAAESPERAVARELLELQQRQGGSAVDREFRPKVYPEAAPTSSERARRHWFPFFSYGRARQASWEEATDGGEQRGVTKEAMQTQLLRESAWQLDNSAQRLEMHELYEQADTLREVAQRLRMSARETSEQAKRRTSPSDGATPRPKLRSDSPRNAGGRTNE